MPVTDVRKDIEHPTMTMTAEFDAAVERVWELWAHSCKLERWWGPPDYPATFIEHDLVADGIATHLMAGREGERHHGWWRLFSVDPPKGLSLQDGFGERPEEAATDLPMAMTRSELSGRPDGGTVMVAEGTFAFPDEMRKLLETGMEDGLKLALGQMDGILAEG